MNKFILSMKNNKATGCDGIPAEARKILTKLFNMISSKRDFPKECKTAQIQPICKGKGNPRQPGDYRGISLLPVSG
jgi:hypothetical protein